MLVRILSDLLIIWIDAMKANPKETGIKTLKVLISILIILAISFSVITFYKIYENKNNPNIIAEKQLYTVSFEEHEDNFLNEVKCYINIKQDITVEYIYIETNNGSFAGYFKDNPQQTNVPILVDTVHMESNEFNKLKIKEIVIEGKDSSNNKFKAKLNYIFHTVKYLDSTTGNWISIK